MGKDDELIVNFMYPKLLDDNLKGQDWLEAADKDYNILRTKPHLVACLMMIKNEEGGWNELQYHKSHDWLMPVIKAIQQAMIDLGIPNYDKTKGYNYWIDKMKEKFWDVDHLYKVIGDCLAWLKQKYGNREMI